MYIPKKYKQIIIVALAVSAFLFFFVSTHPESPSKVMAVIAYFFTALTLICTLLLILVKND